MLRRNNKYENCTFPNAANILLGGDIIWWCNDSFLHQPTVVFCLGAADNHVLEIVDRDLVIDNADRDPTCMSQHWNVYPLHMDYKEEEIFVILSQKSKKALQWDGHRLIVKPYDYSDEAQQWTWDGKFFISPKKEKRLRAFQAVC